MKKNILFIYNLAFWERHSRHIHSDWVSDCKCDYTIKVWGKGFTPDKKLTLRSLKKEIDVFKPDYIYLTGRKKYNFADRAGKKKITKCWLPDLSSIKVPKIFVEVDTFRYNSNDSWYKQFDKLYCRSNKWGNWQKVPIMKWSVSEAAFPKNGIEATRKGVFFVGTIDRKPYWYRQKIRNFLKDRATFCTVKTNEYWEILHKASALICPTEGRIIKETVPYVPAKFFEYVASGAAVLTNCDIASSNIPELDDVIIKYSSLEDLRAKLKMDFKPYYNRGISIMKNNTHRVRYKELFG